MPNSALLPQNATPMEWVAAQLLAGGASNVAATPAALTEAGVIYLVESKSDGANRYRRFSDGSVEMMGIGSCPRRSGHSP